MDLDWSEALVWVPQPRSQWRRGEGGGGLGSASLKSVASSSRSVHGRKTSMRGSIAEASGLAQLEVRTHIREVSLGARRKQGDLLGLHG